MQRVLPSERDALDDTKLPLNPPIISPRHKQREPGETFAARQPQYRRQQREHQENS